MRTNFKAQDPEGWAKADASVKTLDPAWSACENCGGIVVTVCTNGCHLTEEARSRFAECMRRIDARRGR